MCRSARTTSTITDFMYRRFVSVRGLPLADLCKSNRRSGECPNSAAQAQLEPAMCNQCQATGRPGVRSLSVLALSCPGTLPACVRRAKCR